MKAVVLSEKYNHGDHLKSIRNTRIIARDTMRNGIVYWEEFLESARERERERGKELHQIKFEIGLLFV